jgi:hypothetical protein
MAQELFDPEDHAEMVENQLANKACQQCGEPVSGDWYCDACLAHHEDLDRLVED